MSGKHEQSPCYDAISELIAADAHSMSSFGPLFLGSSFTLHSRQCLFSLLSLWIEHVPRTLPIHT